MFSIRNRLLYPEQHGRDRIYYEYYLYVRYKPDKPDGRYTACVGNSEKYGQVWTSCKALCSAIHKTYSSPGLRECRNNLYPHRKLPYCKLDYFLYPVDLIPPEGFDCQREA